MKDDRRFARALRQVQRLEGQALELSAAQRRDLSDQLAELLRTLRPRDDARLVAEIHRLRAERRVIYREASGQAIGPAVDQLAARAAGSSSA